MNQQEKYGTIVERMKNYMVEALLEGKKSEALNEVPIGAIIVDSEGQIIGRGHNLIITDKDPTAHAELIAIRQAAAHVGRERLPGCSMYVTIEPCPMCAGAIVHARLSCVHIGAMDPKTGACGSVFNILQDNRLNHQTEIRTGEMEEECRAMMQRFFKKLRQRNGGNIR